MKKSIFTYASLILSAATLLSCQKLEEVNDSLVAAGTHSVVVTTDATRTVNDGMHTYFEDGDKMTVIYNRDGSSNYHANEYTFSSSTGEFSGGGDIRSQYNYNWFGVYPSNSAITTAKSVSVSIPVSQTQVGNDSKAALAGTGFPLAGKTNALVKGGVTPSFNVSNVATVLDFKITNGSATPLTVTKVEFTAPDGIAGSFTADLTASNISWTAATSASKTVTLNVASGAALEKGASADFYAGAGPFSGPGSYTIKVTAKDAEGQTFVSSKTINGSLNCKSNTVNTISHTFVPGEPVTGVTGYELVTSEPSDWSGRYILVSADKKLVFTGDNGTSNKYTLSSTDLSDGIITKDCSAYEFTITKSGSNYYLKNTAKNQYLYCDYSGNSNTGMSYSSSQRALNLKVQNDGTFGFWMREGSTDQYIYYKSSSGYFKFGGSHDNHCVYLYKWTEGGTPDVPPTPSTDKTYKKVTSFTSGKHYVIAEGTNALKNNNGNIASASINGKVSGNTLTLTSSEAASLEWTATSSSVKPSQGEFTLNNGSSYLRRANSTNAAQLAAYDSGSAGYFVWFLSGTGNNLYNVNSTGQYTFYLDYNNGWTANQQNATNAIVVYEEDGSTPATKQNQTLSFASSSVEWTLGDTYKVGGTYDAQAVTGAKTTVTFKSSDTSVATISDGKIKIVREGTTTITATAAEDDTWYGASASYTLKINPAPVQPSVSGYELVTSEPSDWSGSYLIVDVNKAKVFTGKTDQSNYYTLKSSDIEGNVITNSSLSQYAFTITKNGNNFYLKQGNNYYSVNWTSNSSTGIVTSTSQTAISYGGVLSNGAFLFYGVDSNVNKYLYVKSGEAYFKFGESGGKTGILLYKYTDGSTPATKQDQNLSFTKSSKTINSDTFTLGSGTYIAPTLIGAMTTPVTWTSSKTSVATVSNNGIVTIVAAGTTTITASAPASDTYNEASASYELTVSPAQEQPTTKTYTKVTSLQSGKKYVIVHSGHALQNNNGNPAAYSVTASGNTLTVSADVAATLEWTATSESASTTTGHFSLSNSGKYAARTGGNNNTFGFESSVGAKSVWDLDNAGNDLYHKNSTGQYTFYLTYSNGWSVNSTSEGNSIAVYVEDGSTPDVPPTPPTPSGERTYTKVNSLSEGTYLICGYESDSGKKGTYVCLFPPVNTSSSSIKSSNRCAEFKFSDDNNITEITTDNASIIGSEVTITKSGSNWLVQYNGQYMYYNNGAIAFTSTASSAAQSISLSSGKGAMKHGSQEFYHSGTDKAFGYSQNKGASNLMFFKKEGSSIPSEPTADGTVFNLENSSVSNFLTEAASRYTDGNWSSTSVVTNYCKSGWGNSYTADNREDIPAPVTITWSNQASGTKTLTVYNDSNRTDIETSVTTTSTSAEIYNLIPGRTYYYTVSTTGNSNIASGYFKTEGRRRMMLVGKKSDFGQDYANNCRDFGGLTTTNGKTVKYNKIFRGSNMDRTSNDQRSYLKGYMSIDLDVDLRGNSGNPLGVTLSNQYYNSWNDLSNSTKMKATLNDIFTAVKNNKTIYIHCLVGADRTGYVCMLLQALLGVSEKDCSIDYELTSFSTIGVRARNGQGDVYFEDGVKHIEKQSGSTFQQKAVNYVKSLGFTDSDIQTFQNNMLQ